MECSTINNYYSAGCNMHKGTSLSKHVIINYKNATSLLINSKMHVISSYNLKHVNKLLNDRIWCKVVKCRALNAIIICN